MLGHVPARRLPMNPIQARMRAEIERQEQEAKLSPAAPPPQASDSASVDSSIDEEGLEPSDLASRTGGPMKQTFWSRPDPVLPAALAPLLPRELKPKWVPSTYLRPSPAAFSPARGKAADIAIGGDLVGAGEEMREHLRRTYTSGKGSGSPLNHKLHMKMMSRYGNYPLATRDRMDELRKEQGERGCEEGASIIFS